MTSYKFATGKKVHRFCGTCGSSVCIDFLGEWKAAGDVIGINVSALEVFSVSLPCLLVKLKLRIQKKELSPAHERQASW